MFAGNFKEDEGVDKKFLKIGGQNGCIDTVSNAAHWQAQWTT